MAQNKKAKRLLRKVSELPESKKEDLRVAMFNMITGKDTLSIMIIERFRGAVGTFKHMWE